MRVTDRRGSVRNTAMVESSQHSHRGEEPAAESSTAVTCLEFCYLLLQVTTAWAQMLRSMTAG